MERCCERDHLKAAERLGEFLGAHAHPSCVRGPGPVGEALGFGEHVGIGVETDDLIEEVSQLQGHDARTAPDVEEPAVTVEVEVDLQRSGEALGVGETTL